MLGLGCVEDRVGPLTLSPPVPQIQENITWSGNNCLTRFPVALGPLCPKKLCKDF